jgi:prevent-host-death family protein
MRTVNLHAAKTHFSRLVDEAAAGAEIIIAKAGTPAARLVPLVPLVSSDKRPKRKLGALAGQGSVPKDFDAPLPDSLLDAFEGR